MDNAKKISLQCQIVQSKGNIVSDMDGEKVMLNVQKGKYYNLGEIGGEIWDAISKPIQVNQLIDLLLSNYNIGQLECENQVLPYLDRLVHENIIHIVEESHT
ncbi:lasso peptide biosynthesis PqqD family chaperone [Bacillus pacificus]|uniref:lasso peptide biosynthesis PqqD family chaperone n=1 Tax=Bacillus pacificus TaxID=2026187 RepID=UPI003D1E108B